MITPRSGSRTGLQHVLATHVPAATAPPESRLHGTENLLHRACQVRARKIFGRRTKKIFERQVGDVTVVSELLAVGYRNIDAKNHDSQTAAHIAAYHGHTAVLECLVKHRAKVRIIRDITVTLS